MLKWQKNINRSRATRVTYGVQGFGTDNKLWSPNTVVKIDDKKNAREMFRAVIKRHPNDDYGKEAKSKMKEL